MTIPQIKIWRYQSADHGAIMELEVNLFARAKTLASGKPCIITTGPYMISVVYFDKVSIKTGFDRPDTAGTNPTKTII